MIRVSCWRARRKFVSAGAITKCQRLSRIRSRTRNFHRTSRLGTTGRWMKRSNGQFVSSRRCRYCRTVSTPATSLCNAPTTSEFLSLCSTRARREELTANDAKGMSRVWGEKRGRKPPSAKRIFTWKTVSDRGSISLFFFFFLLRSASVFTLAEITSRYCLIERQPADTALLNKRFKNDRVHPDCEKPFVPLLLPSSTQRADCAFV